jgi:RHS repeat-associated protein
LITDTYDYNAYGTILDQSGSTNNNYQYTGEQFDPALDNYYLRARYYDPAVGRFTQMDSWMGRTQDPATLHKYLYTHADPVNGIDPSGNAGLFGFSVAQNINAILITTSVVSTTYNIFQIASGEKELTAKEVGFTVLLALAGPAVGKLIKFVAKKQRDKILKIPGRVRSRVNLANCVTRKESGRCSEGWEHVIDAHINGPASKSQFSVSETELRVLLQSSKVVGSLPKDIGGRYLRIVNLGKIIGNDVKSGGNGTKYMSIITDKFGNLLTATPGKIQ